MKKALQLSPDAHERYARHLVMPEIGEKGQLKLCNSKVLLVGMGGLGSPAAFYLAAAGVGTLGLIDHDVVDRSNLQRQILHTDERVGMAKVKSAKKTLLALNPSINVTGHKVRLDSSNVDEIFDGYDVIVDCSDNFPTRYLINDACIKLKKPNVHGSIYRFEGQISVFYPSDPQQKGPCYRCLYPKPPPPDMAPSSAEAGVIGVLPGVIGALQAVETVKLVLGFGSTLNGRLPHFDALTTRFSLLKLERDANCAYCSSTEGFPGYIDYEEFCATTCS